MLNLKLHIHMKISNDYDKLLYNKFEGTVLYECKHLRIFLITKA
jgi:hypothetical protein